MPDDTLVRMDAKEILEWDRTLAQVLQSQIKNTEMFEDFTDAEINIFAKYAHPYHIDKGMPILKEGDVDCYMCIVTKGVVDIYRESSDGSRVKISAVNQGQSIGEMSLLDGLPNSATAIAATECSVVLISKKHMMTLTQEHPEVGILFLWKLGEFMSLRLRCTSGMLADTTIHKASLKVSRDEARQSSHRKSTFLSGMSHELRTPLNAIIGYTELLKEIEEESGRDDCKHDLDKILSAGKHLLELINNVLDLSKVEAGKMEVYQEKFELLPFLDDIQHTVLPLVHKNKNHLALIVETDCDVICIDKVKLKQVLLNLLSNASKFTHNGKIEFKISDHVEHGWLIFSIADNGKGMTSNEISQLFIPFSQANVNIQREFGGTGLGLSISQRLTEIMQGEIMVESEVGKGSTFKVRLPAVNPTLS